MNYPENREKYNGIEYTSELDLDIYDAQLRNLNPQIGRWNQIDPKIENMEAWSPYATNYDNPIRYNDFLGDEGEDPNKKGFFRSIVTGFTGYFKNIGNAVANPVPTLKAMASPQNLLKSSLNGATLGLSGAISSAGDNARVVMNEGAAGLGKVIGEALAEGAVVAGTEGAAKGIGAIRTATQVSKLSTQVGNAALEMQAGGNFLRQ